MHFNARHRHSTAEVPKHIKSTLAAHYLPVSQQVEARAGQTQAPALAATTGEPLSRLNIGTELVGEGTSAMTGEGHQE